MSIMLSRWFSVLGRRLRTVHPATLLVLLAALSYSALFTALSILKLRTYHATFGDLGLENHILWLLSHGGLPTYSASGFSTVYAFNFQKPVVLLLLPFYALYPEITFLLTVQSFVLGLAAVPLYLFAREKLSSPWTAALVGVSYLFYFPIASANLFDFHYETFFPLFFFLLLLAWAKHWRRGMYAACLLCASINPLPLVTMVLFLLYLPIDGRRFPRPRWSELREYLHRLTADPLHVATLIVLLLLPVLYKAIGSLPLAGVGSSAGHLSPLEILLFDVNGKLFLFLLLFGALAFLPLFDRLAVVLTIPYVAFAFYSADSANWQAFGLAYTTLAVGPLYMGLTRVLADRLRERSPLPGPSQASTGVRESSSARFRRPIGASDPRRVFAAVVLVFALVYFPVSPVNAYVARGYFAGNHDLGGITTITPESRFLDRVLALIPGDGAVLTQNDIPQVSGREFYQVDQYYTTATPYNYILMDSAEAYFTDPATMLAFVQPALANHTFGVVAEGLGALLLERGYNASPRLFEPTQASFDTHTLSALTASDVVGDRIVGSAKSFSLWYGPFATLYPGNYTAAFVLESNLTGNATTGLLRIDVTANKGSLSLASENLFASNFTATNVATVFLLHFHLANIATNVELRGMSPTGVATIALDRIYLNQTSAT